MLTCESGGLVSRLRRGFVLSFVYDAEMSFFIALKQELLAYEKDILQQKLKN